jgi:hypothetical protein
MALVPNAPTVATKSSTMLTLYVGIAANVVDMTIKVLESPSIADAHLGWVQPALLVLMAAAAVFRVIKQESISGPTPPPAGLSRE